MLDASSPSTFSLSAASNQKCGVPLPDCSWCRALSNADSRRASRCRRRCQTAMALNKIRAMIRPTPAMITKVIVVASLNMPQHNRCGRAISTESDFSRNASNCSLSQRRSLSPPEPTHSFQTSLMTAGFPADAEQVRSDPHRSRWRA